MTAPGGSSPMRIGGAALLAAGVVAGIIGVATVVGDGDEGVSSAAPGTTGAASESAAAPPPGEPAPGSDSVAVPSFGAPPPPGGAAPPPGADGGNGPGGTGPGGSGPGGSGPGGTGPGGTGPGGTGPGGTGPGGTGPGGTAPGSVGAGTAGSGGAGSGGAGSGGTSGGKGTATGGSGGSTAGRSGGASAPQAARMPLRVYNNSMIPGLAAEAEGDFESAGWTVTEVGNYNRGIIPTSTVYYRPGTAEQASAQRLAAEFGLRANPRFEGIEDASPGLIVILTRDYQRR